MSVALCCHSHFPFATLSSLLQQDDFSLYVNDICIHFSNIASCGIFSGSITKDNVASWFLKENNDVRSSLALEDAATEFQVQGLELDWAGLIWDGDLIKTSTDWLYKSFVGTKWNNIMDQEAQKNKLNAYRVLLTRARQGMIIVVPEGDPLDKTRDSEKYDPTWNYLKDIGLDIIQKQQWRVNKRERVITGYKREE